tara:strand:- start:3949 stop:4176 length:228 start_codon:yes stop_codon:yes gene_type:complete
MGIIYEFKNILNYYFGYLSYQNKYHILLKENKLLKKKNKKLKKKFKNLSNNDETKISDFSQTFNIDETYYPIQAF